MSMRRIAVFILVFSVSQIITNTELDNLLISRTEHRVAQNAIISLIGNDLSPGSSTLVASLEQFGNAAVGLTRTTPDCGIDALVANGAIRPDAADAGTQAVTAMLPGQQYEFLAAAEGLGEPITPVMTGLMATTHSRTRMMAQARLDRCSKTAIARDALIIGSDGFGRTIQLLRRRRA